MTDEAEAAFGRLREPDGRAADARDIDRRVRLLERFVEMSDAEPGVQVVFHLHVPEPPFDVDRQLARPQPHDHVDRFGDPRCRFARVRPEDLHVGRDGSRSETDIEPAVRHVIQERQPPRHVGRMVVLQADRRRSDANALRQAEHFCQEDLRHDDVLDARRMVLADPEIVEAEFLALHGQLEVLVDALSQRLGRIMNRHDEHAESQRLSVAHSSPSGLCLAGPQHLRGLAEGRFPASSSPESPVVSTLARPNRSVTADSRDGTHHTDSSFPRHHGGLYAPGQPRNGQAGADPGREGVVIDVAAAEDDHDIAIAAQVDLAAEEGRDGDRAGGLGGAGRAGRTATASPPRVARVGQGDRLTTSRFRIGQLCSPTSYDSRPSQMLVGVFDADPPPGRERLAEVVGAGGLDADDPGRAGSPSAIASACPAINPPPLTGQTKCETPAPSRCRSRTISRAPTPLPAITWGSSYGEAWTAPSPSAISRVKRSRSPVW